MVFENYFEFTEKGVQESMRKGMKSLEGFDTNENVTVSSASPNVVDLATTLTWVLVWESVVKSRLCVRGYRQQVSSFDDACASTPVIYVVRILLVIALARRWMIYFFDIAAAFVHAPLNSDEPIHVWPPAEFYPVGNVLWKPKEAMYGLSRPQKTCNLTGLQF